MIGSFVSNKLDLISLVIVTIILEYEIYINIQQREVQSATLSLAQIFSQPKILVGPNFSRPKFLAGPKFSHQGKIWSLRTDEVWADKVVDTFSQELTKIVILFSKT